MDKLFDMYEEESDQKASGNGELCPWCVDPCATSKTGLGNFDETRLDQKRTLYMWAESIAQSRGVILHNNWRLLFRTAEVPRGFRGSEIFYS